MPPGAVNTMDIGDTTAAGTPAMMALPVNPTPTDGNSSRRWWNISVSLREIYDDNANTTSANKQASLETEFTPSVLVDFPVADGELTARYTFGFTYYNDLNNVNNSGTNGGGAVSNQSADYTNELNAQYSHSFSSRFNLSVADDFRFFTDPNILQSTGTNYQNGPYIANILNGSLSAQWTPLIGTTTGYSNSIVAYEDSQVGNAQNSVENTGSQSIGFAILPKINLSFGGIADDTSYETADRGYTSYTGFTGVSWAALPSVSVSGRAGGTYTETVQSAQNQGSSGSFSPYAAFSVGWTLGARSSLAFDYAHEITPTDQALANGQSSDRVSANFNYAINPDISTFLAGIYTLADVSSSLLASSSIEAYTQTSYEVDTGFSYHYNNYLNFDAGVQISGVSSGPADSDYTRDRISVGVRGTY
jgi:hypothetical protein